LAKQILEPKLIVATEPQSSVSKYIAIQEKAEKPAVATGVAKYLSKQEVIEKDQPHVSGVSKYLAKQLAHSQELAIVKSTGVEKYLRKLA
jgi:hypothetical protein